MQIAETCDKTAKLDCGNVFGPSPKMKSTVCTQKKVQKFEPKTQKFHNCIQLVSIFGSTIAPWVYKQLKTSGPTLPKTSPNSLGVTVEHKVELRAGLRICHVPPSDSGSVAIYTTYTNGLAVVFFPSSK